VDQSKERLNLQGVASLGLLRLCFAKLLASLVGQPDAFGAGESRDGTWDGRRVVYEEPKFVYIRVGRSPIRVAGLAENRRLEWRGDV